MARKANAGVAYVADAAHPFEMDGAQPWTRFSSVFDAAPLQRIAMIKAGLKARQAKDILARLDVSQAVAMEALNLSVATVNKKALADAALTPDESERVIGLARLIGQVEAMVGEAAADFDAAAWLSRWLTEPLAAFGGRRPLDLIDTMEGQGLISTTLGQMQSGAYA